MKGATLVRGIAQTLLLTEKQQRSNQLQEYGKYFIVQRNTLVKEYTTHSMLEESKMSR